MSENDNAADEQVRSRARRQLLWMFGIAFAVLGGSYGLFLYAQSGGSWGTTNNGEFVRPATSAADLGVEGFETEGRWWLWLATERCDAACDDMLDKLQALHILLNRESDRVSRALLSAGTPSVDDEHLAKHPRPAGLKEGIYIVDPLGNLVFRYASDSDPKLVLEDLKKLLKLSQIG